MSTSARRRGKQQKKAINAILDEVAKRRLSPHQRLPSIRALAQKLEVSNSTIVDAYDRLVADGTVNAKPGSGFYVGGKTAPLSLIENENNAQKEIDPVWMARQSLLIPHRNAAPGCGWLPASWMAEDEIARALRAIARSNDANLTDYGSPQGLPELRQLIARRQADFDIDVSPNQIILTDSGTHAIDLLCRFLLKPGDTVMLDDPCYFNFQAMLRAHNVNVISAPMRPNGVDLAAFETTCAAEPPRLYITNAVLHNPTGVSPTNKHVHQLLKLAEQYDFMIIEDDIFADLEEKPTPRFSAFDGFERVIKTGSFSKTLSAAVRCGFIIAKPDWVDEIVNLKLATSYGTASFNAQLIYRLLTEGAYRRHVNGMKDKLKKQMSFALTQLENLGIKPWHIPDAGMFLWCELPNAQCGEALARAAMDEDLMLAPGNAFSPTLNSKEFMRFNIAQMNYIDIFKRLERALNRAAKQ
jgi:DNA-binding transcriptional MocR family regulator